MQNLIRPFSTISAVDINEVGGKGANLGELLHAGFEVPDGFCVTTQAYKAFILPKQKQLFKLLEKLDANDLNALRAAGKKVRNMLGKLDLPAQLEKPLIKAWRETGDENAYAVRSSATAEDLPQASFAGQQDTYLNIIGRDNLLDSVRDCFISLFTDRAILYRAQNNFDHEDVQLSVIVQKMVIPDASGILFTADPVNGNRNVISIDASFGIGEALVSGLVTADLYQVDKITNSILKKQIGDKKIAILAQEGGGTKTVDLDSAERGKTTLNDDQIIALTRLGIDIENHYGTPQDIEWALVGDKFHITQSRPITSLFPLPVTRIEADKIYISLSHFQVMTDAMPPLSISLFTSIFPIGRDETTGENRYVLPVGGRFYGEMSNVLNHPITGKIFPNLVYRADHLVGKMIGDWQRDKPRPVAKSKISLFKLLPIILPFMWQVRSCLFSRKYHDFPVQMSNYMDEFVEQVRAKVNGASNVAGQLDICVHAMRNLIHTIEPWRAHFIASMVALKLLDIAMKNRVAPTVMDALMRGLEGNVTTEMDLAVGDLADVARSFPALVECLGDGEIGYQEKLKCAADLPSGDKFIAAWKTFLDEYGSRGPSEIDLYRPRWREDGSSLMTMVAGLLKSGEEGAHRVHYQRLISENAQANDTIIDAAGKGFFGFLRRPFVRRLTYVIRELFPLREHHKFLMIKTLDLTKPVIEEAGIKLHAEGKIEHRDDVWFMNLYELQNCIGKDICLEKHEIARRKQEHEHHKNIAPPRVMTGEGKVLSASYDTDGAPNGALIGAPVSAGIVEGIAKVVLDPAQEALHPGEILIAPFTDPGWTPLFVNAAGLVTEVGGMMTHGSVIAREYGIPAVVGVIDATRKITSGQKIRVHGGAGFIEILDDIEEQRS